MISAAHAEAAATFTNTAAEASHAPDLLSSKSEHAAMHQQPTAPYIALDSPQHGAALSAERDDHTASAAAARPQADGSLGQEGKSILQQLTREHGAQVQEAQFTRLALLELQKKRVQMEHARSTIMEALESGDVNALEKLKDLGTLGLDDDLTANGEEVLDDNLLDMIADAHALGVTRKHIAKAVTQRKIAETNAPSVQATASRDIDDEMTNEKLNEIMSTLASGNHDYDREAMAEVKRLKLMESWEELKSLKKQFNDLNGRTEDMRPATATTAAGDDLPSSPDTGPYSSPEAMARGAAAADEKWQQVAALQEELNELQAYKERLEQRNRLLATHRGQRCADASSDSLATLVRSSPGKRSAEGPLMSYKNWNDQTKQDSHGSFRSGRQQQNDNMRRSGTDDLIERLVDASVRNATKDTHQAQTSRPSRVEIIEETGAGNPLALKLREIPSQVSLTRHTPPRKAPAISNQWDATPHQVLAAAERDTALDAARVEQGLQEVLSNMRTIQMVRHVAKGPERAQFDAVFEQLQIQLAELQEVQSKVAYFRQLVEQQQEEQSALLADTAQGAAPQRAMPKTTSPPLKRTDAATTTRGFDPGLSVGSCASQTRENYRPGPAVPASPYKLGRPSQAWPSPKRQPDRADGDVFATDERARQMSASWNEQANVNEYNLLNYADAEADLRTSFYEASQRVKENQFPHRHIDPLVKGLFEECREVIYRTAAAFISGNEAEPYFLMELFKKAGKLDTSFARQKLLMEMDKIVAICAEGKREQDRRPLRPTISGASSLTERVQTPFNDSHFDSPAKDTAVRAFSVGGDSITEGRRSMAPSPFANVSNASMLHTAASTAVPARLTSEKQTSNQPSAPTSQEAEQVASIVQDMLIAFMARMREPCFTAAHVADMQLIVLAAVSKHLEASEQLGVGSLRDLLQPVLDDAFNRFVGRHAAEVGSVLVDEVGRIVCDVIYVTEDELARSEERMRRDVESLARRDGSGVPDEVLRSGGGRGNGRNMNFNDGVRVDVRAADGAARGGVDGMRKVNKARIDSRTETPSVGSESRMKFFKQSPTPPRGRPRNVVPATAAIAAAASASAPPPQQQPPRAAAYHYAVNCHDRDCRWDHEALDEVVQRLSTKHEWGAIMQAIQRVEDCAGVDGLSLMRDDDEDEEEEEEEWETESDDEEEEEDSMDGSDSAEDDVDREDDSQNEGEKHEEDEEEEEYETVDDMQYRYDAETKGSKAVNQERAGDDEHAAAPAKNESSGAPTTPVSHATDMPSSSTSRTVTPDITRAAATGEHQRPDPETNVAHPTSAPPATDAVDDNAEREPAKPNIT
ncbi:hypothetical protein HDU86_006732 [Geranomyces michiganensis]|nr:hypothetical protein HDU86_006732 [Geranomyces michiganensis]